jgi:hypothetical protein
VLLRKRNSLLKKRIPVGLSGGETRHSGVWPVAMPLCIDIKQLPDHFLILRMMFFGFPFKKIKTGAAERERDPDIFLFKDELFRRGEKIINYADFT